MLDPKSPQNCLQTLTFDVSHLTKYFVAFVPQSRPCEGSFLTMALFSMLTASPAFALLAWDFGPLKKRWRGAEHTAALVNSHRFQCQPHN